MKNVTFFLHSKSTEPSNTGCTATWSFEDEEITLEFNDSKSAFAADKFIRSVCTSFFKDGKEFAKQTIQFGLNNI